MQKYESNIITRLLIISPLVFIITSLFIGNLNIRNIAMIISFIIASPLIIGLIYEFIIYFLAIVYISLEYLVFNDHKDSIISEFMYKLLNIQLKDFLLLGFYLWFNFCGLITLAKRKESYPRLKKERKK